jgi:hypothetical protein
MPAFLWRFRSAMNKAPPQPSLIVAKPAPVIDTAIAGCVAIPERHIPAGLRGAPTADRSGDRGVPAVMWGVY